MCIAMSRVPHAKRGRDNYGGKLGRALCPAEMITAAGGKGHGSASGTAGRSSGGVGRMIGNAAWS